MHPYLPLSAAILLTIPPSFKPSILPSYQPFFLPSNLPPYHPTTHCRPSHSTIPSLNRLTPSHARDSPALGNYLRTRPQTYSLIHANPNFRSLQFTVPIMAYPVRDGRQQRHQNSTNTLDTVFYSTRCPNVRFCLCCFSCAVPELT